jgi:hypothetical protein
MQTAQMRYDISNIHVVLGSACSSCGIDWHSPPHGGGTHGAIVLTAGPPPPRPLALLEW